VTGVSDRIRRLSDVHDTPARRNSAGSLAILGSQRLARVATIVAAAAVLDPTRFAGLAVALALTDIVRAGLLAYDISAVRSLTAGGDKAAVMGAHLTAKFFVGVIGTAAVVVLSGFAYGADTTLLVVVTSLGSIPGSLAYLLLARRQVDFRLGSAASIVTATSAIGAGLAIAGLLLTDTAFSVAAGLAIGDILMFVALAGGLREARRVPLAEIGALVGRTWTLLLMNLAYVGQFRVGIVVLGAFGSAVAVAEYTVASRIAEGLVILASALTASSLPMMGAAFAGADTIAVRQTMGRVYRFSLLAAAPMVAILTLTAPLWIAILFPRYPGAAEVFIPVGLTVIVFFANSQTTALLNASHRDRIAALSATVGLVVAVVGSVWLVALGAIGVAVARLVAEIARLTIETATVAQVAGYVMRSIAAAWVAIIPVLLVVVAPAVVGWSIPVIVLGAAIVAFSVIAGVRSWRAVPT
jgi:O-antigen/teichoic acid export membrane protein